MSTDDIIIATAVGAVAGAAEGPIGALAGAGLGVAGVVVAAAENQVKQIVITAGKDFAKEIAAGLLLAGAHGSVANPDRARIVTAGSTHEVNKQGVQYHDNYVRPRSTKVGYRRTRAPSRAYSRPVRSYKRWGGTSTRRVAGAGRYPYRARYPRTRGTYGRSMYGTGRPSRRYYSQRKPSWYR